MVNKTLDGKVAVVTGATRGIGWAIAELLQEHGAEVVGTGVQSNGSVPSACKFQAVDLSDPVMTRDFAAHLRSLSPDILVNNAGINKLGRFAEIDADDFRCIQTVNVEGVFHLCQAALPGMLQNKWGRIVNICSVWGIVGKELRASYSTSKFAVAGMTAALAAEVAAAGVLANCVSPGIIETEMTRSVIDETQLGELIQSVPAKRLGKPNEVAQLVAWLASPLNTFVTGQNIAIDGGLTRGQ